MKKNFILWILLIVLVVLIIVYTIFYLTNYKSKDYLNDENIDGKLNINVNDTWTYLHGMYYDLDGNIYDNHVGITKFIFYEKEMDICYKKSGCKRMNYTVEGNKLYIKKQDNSIIKFVATYENDLILLKETIEEKMTYIYYFQK